MNRPTRRFLHASLGFAALTAFIGTAYPRMVAWSNVSNGHLIASTRAASCLVTPNTLVPNTVMVDDRNFPLAPGRFICDWQGNTGQTTKAGEISFIRSGQPEQITAILISRGFKRPR